jgi:peptide/nickel transport system ATP-binding protein
MMDLPDAPPPLLEMRAIRKDFSLYHGSLARLMRRGPVFSAVRDVDLLVRRGEIVGLVGESGSGKTTLAQIAVRLIAPTSGQLIFNGDNISSLSSRALQPFRRRVQMVFQDTGSALNPRKTVATVLHETLRLRGISLNNHAERIGELLKLVGLGPYVLPRYPHQLSGGQRQRVGITRALAMQPEMLVADEPVSSLDVSLQAQIINLLADLRSRLGLSMLFISHDLALVGFMCDRIAVMYRGQIVEQGLPREVLRAPMHPYTQTLVGAVPAGIAGRKRARKAILATEDLGLAVGCSFAPRCPMVMPKCREIDPTPVDATPTHRIRCHLHS